MMLHIYLPPRYFAASTFKKVFLGGRGGIAFVNRERYFVLVLPYCYRKGDQSAYIVNSKMYIVSSFSFSGQRATDEPQWESKCFSCLQ